MYLYYQTTTAKDEQGNGESWKYIKDSPGTRESLAEKQVHMVSMLAISTVDYSADYEQLKYRGDLYFDIDVDQSQLQIAIDATKELVAKLKALDVYDINVFVSGKKGFHVTVPAKVFCTNPNAGIKWLPYIYGRMATTLFEVPGLDMSVYSGGKGRLWRQPNVKRLDNGKYKVPIRVEVLEEITPENYLNFCSEPNHTFMESIKKAEPTFSLALSSAFEEAMSYVKAEQESKEVFRFEPMPELEMLSEVPGCILKLAKGEDVKEGANFNKAAMNLAGYLKAANRIGTDTADDLVGLLASHNNFNSATYTNESTRRLHIKGMLRRAGNDRSMGCNPAFILSLVDRCGGCVVCNGTLKSSSSKKETKEETKGGRTEEDGLRKNVFEVGFNYLKEYGPRSSKSLTTFILEPISANIFFHKEANAFRRESLSCEVKYSAGEGKVKTTSVTIEENAWDSPSLFKKQFQGIDNLAITASEDDLADLRHYIMSKYNDIDNSIRTTTIGLDVREIPHGDKICQVLVYTEPGYTASGTSIKVPIHYASSDRGSIVGAPAIHKAPNLSADNVDDVMAVKRLFRINEPWICATMVGWMAATALKPHIMSLFNEFPLMAVTGQPGTGKTTLSCIMADLAGCSFKQADEPASATSTQAFIERYIAGSTSVPRILDEANDPAFRSNPKLLETLKGVWNGLELGKSSYEQGAGGSLATRSVKLTGPLLYISEQPRSDDALRQRGVEVFLSLGVHGTTAAGEDLPRDQLSPEVREVVENFEWVSEHEQRDRLRGAAKAIINQALKTKKSWVRERLAEYAVKVRGARAHTRQKYSWRVVLMGLDLYELALKETYHIDVSAEVTRAKDIILARLLDEEVTNSGTENCNNEVMQFIAVMSERAVIAELKDSYGKDLIARGSDYYKDEDSLRINMNTLWPSVMAEARRTGTNLKYTSARQFLSAVIHEPYAVSVKNGILTVSADLLKASGVSANYFYSDEEYEEKFGGM